MNGVLVLNKPQGLSSNQALQRVKRLLGARKAGHTGSLDPLATGVLPLCFGQATKLSQYLLDADKRYRVTAHLGVSTDTGDAEGQVIARASGNLPVSDAQWQQVMQRFLGMQTQQAPLYSALKYKGKPLYHWARQGVSVPKKSRDIVIHQLVLERYQHPFVTLDVRCSKGTYIRSLVDDIGNFLNQGAHVVELARTQAGPYRIQQAVSVAKIEAFCTENGNFRGDFCLDQVLLPMSSVLPEWPEVVVTQQQLPSLLQGQTVSFVPNDPLASECVDFATSRRDVFSAHDKPLNTVKLFSEQADFIGIGRLLSDNRVAPKKLFIKPNDELKKLRQKGLDRK